MATLVNELHPENARARMLTTDVGIVIRFTFCMIPAHHPDRFSLVLPGSMLTSTVVNAVHRPKARGLMLLTDVGIVTLLNESNPAKAPAPMLATDDGIVTVVKELVQPCSSFQEPRCTVGVAAAAMTSRDAEGGGVGYGEQDGGGVCGGGGVATKGGPRGSVAPSAKNPIGSCSSVRVCAPGAVATGLASFDPPQPMSRKLNFALRHFVTAIC